ncbi:MAG: hypothetical protein CMN72_08985 [Sphingomonas sp.]|nr:hypothetical protein [Sphingomonas sp.]
MPPALHFPRPELRDHAAAILADRQASDPRSVKLGKMTPHAAAIRSASMGAIVAILTAIIDEQTPPDPENRWLDTDGCEGVLWAHLRSDLANTAKRAAEVARRDPSNERATARAVALAELAWHFAPGCRDGITPRIVFAADIERTFRKGAAAAMAKKAA